MYSLRTGGMGLLVPQRLPAQVYVKCPLVPHYCRCCPSPRCRGTQAHRLSTSPIILFPPSLFVWGNASLQHQTQRFGQTAFLATGGGSQFLTSAPKKANIPTGIPQKSHMGLSYFTPRSRYLFLGIRKIQMRICSNFLIHPPKKRRIIANNRHSQAPLINSTKGKTRPQNRNPTQGALPASWKKLRSTLP